MFIHRSLRREAPLVDVHIIRNQKISAKCEIVKTLIELKIRWVEDSLERSTGRLCWRPNRVVFGRKPFDLSMSLFDRALSISFRVSVSDYDIVFR